MQHTYNHLSEQCTASPQGYVRLCIDVMKDDGARITKTRKAVIDCLSKTTQALTPQEIMKRVAASTEGVEGIDLASVYRILKYMSELGLVHQIGPGGGFFPCAHSHCGAGIHLITRCNSCENTSELHIPEDKTTSLMWYLQNEIDFIPEEHILEIKGLCSQCSVSPQTS
jgi:Fe2+ or Zn2+ uptake regulation protein